MNILVAVGASIISGLLGVVITLVAQRIGHSHNQKLIIFRTLLSNRQQLATEENVRALNMIDVVFYRHDDVRARFAEFVSATNIKPADGILIVTKYLRLVETIGKTVGMTGIDWERINSCFYNPVALAERTLENDLLRKATLQSQMELVNRRIEGAAEKHPSHQQALHIS